MTTRLAAHLAAGLAIAGALVIARPGMEEAQATGGQDTVPLQQSAAPANAVFLDTLDLSKVQLRPGPRAARGQTTAPPMVFRLGGVTYPHAVPLRSDADMTIDLQGRATRFLSMIGVDDGAPPAAPQPGAPPAPPPAPGSVVFGVWVDGNKVFESAVMKRGDAPKLVSLDLTGAKNLVLAVNDANDGVAGDNADWAGAMIVTRPGAQAPQVAQPEPEPQPHIASIHSDEPTINYPRITGATPGRPFMFMIPASGEDLTYSARNLPGGLSLDAKTGIISGSLKAPGRTAVQVSVKNGKGQVANAVITIVGGDRVLALTPPLGWNSWNVWGGIVTADHVRAAADGMVRTGLAGQGYTYINIDDAWEGGWRKGPNGRHDVPAGRDANGEIVTNEKFPDMKGLVDYIHGKGLKAGIYSGPGPRTCQGLMASYQHEEQDARTWAKWGFDYLKYDWCSYTEIEPLAQRAPLDALQKPYRVMRAALDKVDRDIVFSLCQYGWGSVWEWGADVGGNLWRVTGDINDTWPSMSSIAFQQTGHERYAEPTHWNDTDMLVVGRLGWGRTDNPRPTTLTPNEQLTHISLWALQAAPMLIGADMANIDQWTVDLLGNREVLAINQDPAGRAAGRIWADNWTQVWARPLADGTWAVGLFNRAPEPMPVTLKFADIGLPDSPPIRYPWTHTDRGARGTTNENPKQITETVPRHGVVLMKVGKSAKSTD
jgi:alpha-galactosidase